MAFVPIINGKGMRSGQPAARVRCYVARNGAQFLFTMTRPIVTSLGWNGGDRILVSFGVSEDFGRLMMNRVSKGGQKLCIGSKSGFHLAMVMPKDGIDGCTREMVAQTIAGPQLCEFEVKDGQLFVAVAPLRRLRKPMLEAVS